MNRRDFLKSAAIFPLILLPGDMANMPQAEEFPGLVYLPSGDGATIQAAIATGKTIVLGQGTWILDEPLRINDIEGVRIYGMGYSLGGTKLLARTPGRGGVEIIGSNNITLQNTNLTGEDCAVGIMTGRSLNRSNSSRIVFRDMWLYGNFDKACWYDVSSETNIWQNCYASPQNNPDSGVTLALTNEYNIPTSVPLSNVQGAAMCSMERMDITGLSQTPLRMYGTNLRAKDSYFYTPEGRAGIEMVGSGGLKLTDCFFEGLPFASLRITAREGNNFSIGIDSMLGSPAEYSIWMDDGTKLSNSRIESPVGLRPVRLWDVQACDLCGMVGYDSRPFSFSCHDVTASHLRLLQNDTWAHNNLWGVTLENCSVWPYKFEYFGFA